MAPPAAYDRCRVTLVFHIKKGDVDETSTRPTVADNQVAAWSLLFLDQQEFDAI